MKKKNILIFLSIILAICICVGAYQVFAPKEVENTISQTATELQSTAEITNETSTEKNNINSTTAKNDGDNSSKSAQNTSNAQQPVENQKKDTKSENSTTKANTTTTTTQKQTVNVNVAITCKNIDHNDILGSTSVTVLKGESVFDATKKICNSKGISLTYQSIYYIQGIGSVMEKDYGASSGWMYRVNGTVPNKSACNYALNDGDIIEWYYVTSPSDK